MEPSARWWNRRTGAPASSLVLIVVVVAVIAAALGVTAMIRLPARGTTCNAVTATADVFPALVAIGTPGGSPTATGTVIRGNGVILTAAAAVPGGASAPVAVTLSDGEAIQAVVVGADAATGLAVVKVERQQLPFLLLSPREPVRAGLPVVGLGSPLLADGAVLSGTVQSVGTAVEISSSPSWKLADAVATDLVAVPGNTGAPVVTCDNRMIGVVVGRASDGSAVLVPAETAQRVVARLLGIS